MPSLNKLWNDNRDKGLHIFHVESQGHTRQQIEEFCKKNKVSFTNVIGRSAFGAYKGDGGLPYAFVIGVDGQVIFQGRGDYKSKIHEELKKVRYPGLGKLTVAKEAQKAAALFSQRQFGKAKVEAAKLVAKVESGKEVEAAALADAKYIVARVEQRATRLQESVESYKNSRDFDLALEQLKKLELYFKGEECSANAKSEAKALRKDPEVKSELKAFAALQSILAKFERRPGAECQQTLDAFRERFKGTRAAERAAGL